MNDCLSVEGNCNIANEETGEVALDLTIKNLNQTHHLFSIDASIGDLFVFCQKFALDKEKIYCKFHINCNKDLILTFLTLIVINNSNTQSASKSELTPNESVNIRCILNEKPDVTHRKTTHWERLKTNLSSYCVKSMQDLKSDVLQMNFASNFLIRSEAKYFPFSQQNITNEDMSHIINANNKHMTLCINWRAVVCDNGKVMRNALGQHFVQIDQLFES